jgi:hypothetical protein
MYNVILSSRPGWKRSMKTFLCEYAPNFAAVATPPSHFDIAAATVPNQFAAAFSAPRAPIGFSFATLPIPVHTCLDSNSRNIDQFHT